MPSSYTSHTSLRRRRIGPNTAVAASSSFFFGSGTPTPQCRHAPSSFFRSFFRGVKNRSTNVSGRGVVGKTRRHSASALRNAQGVQSIHVDPIGGRTELACFVHRAHGTQRSQHTTTTAVHPVAPVLALVAGVHQTGRRHAPPQPTDVVRHAQITGRPPGQPCRSREGRRVLRRLLWWLLWWWLLLFGFHRAAAVLLIPSLLLLKFRPQHGQRRRHSSVVVPIVPLPAIVPIVAGSK